MILLFYSLGVIGAWLFSDGLYSIILYLDRSRFDGTKQTWRKDHWVRLVRMGLGLIVIGIGAVLCVFITGI